MPTLRLALLPLLIGLLSACQTLPPTFQKSAGASIVHAPSKWTFPQEVAGFRRAEVVSYDRSGLDCSVAYNHASMVAATVYVYPTAGRTMDQEVQAVSAVLEQQHHSGPAKIKSACAFSGHAGVRLGHIYQGIFAFRAQELRSQTLLFRIGDRFLKFRITYPAAQATEAEAGINTFLAKYPWP